MRTINTFPTLLFGLVLLLFFSACEESADVRVLVFSKTAGYRHASIEPGIKAIQKLGKENGFKVVSTEDANAFREENLAQYAAVIFLNTTGDVLDHVQQADFERYIQAGGGYVGIHAAADTEYDWMWYGKLVGGYFNGHPNNPNVRKADIQVLDKNHPSTKMLPERWERDDEWYNYKNLNPNTQVLANLDETTYEGGTNGENHPIAWYHDFDGGRAFYTGGGHTDASFVEPLFLEHLLGGIQYAIGDNVRDYTQAHHHRVPAANRFVKTVLAQNLNEPMELDLFPDGRILFVERAGAIKLYDPEKDRLREVTKFPVFTKYEDGLLGMAIDPNYEENKWIYLFYSPLGSKPVQHISRFVFDDDSLHYATEKVVLEIDVQRDECCHSGGSLEFGPDGNLFIGVGDDTNPFDSDGFAPIDERPGRKPWDAQRSAGNTNDLRGKILRITPQADGSYTIPDGNLFPEGTPDTRPEIYVMGCRNPFRLSIDAKTKYLYWGDVGPDAGKDQEDRGPKGIDEINQARTPGFWGWPYSRGNNQAYHDYNFASETSGPLFNTENPINESANNTGLRELPPIQESVIWYSYDKSLEFPWVGTGGKNPMAGPIFYSDLYDHEEKYPEYFDGKLLIYEWMRNWIYLMKFDSSGQVVKIDPFMQNEKFSRPMDMQFGRDGKLYLLEYGKLWFSRNIDARLVRIDYVRGNRAPVAKVTANKLVGAAPLTVIFSAADSYDFDGDPLKYEWRFTGNGVENRSAYPSYTFEKPGVYQVQLKVTDPDKQSSEATIEIQVGNEAPKVEWEIAGNQTFYWDNRQIDYQVQVRDKEDGNTDDGSLSKDQIQVSFDYLPQGYDITTIAQGHQTADQVSSKPKGLELIEASDCASCHAKEKKVNGPSYIQIANRYRDNDFAVSHLRKRIIEGGSGNWGETAMAAHPQLTEEQASEMVLYILSLGAQRKVASDFPAEGTFVTTDHIAEEEKGRYILMASYTDLGNGEITSITEQNQIVLRHPKMEAERYDRSSKEFEIRDGLVRELYHNDFLSYADIDFTDVQALTFAVGMRPDREIGGRMELRLDAQDGELIGQYDIDKPGEHRVNLEKDWTGRHDLFVVFRNAAEQNKQIVMMDWIEVHPRMELLGLK